MRGPSERTPSLRRHKPSSRAVVTLNGKDHYLGPWPAGCKKPAEAIRQAYDQLIAEWLANGRRLQPLPTEGTPGVSIEDLLLAFWRHAEQHYRDVDGSPTNELENIRHALRPLRALYGALPAADFSPLKLKAVRQKLLDSQRYHVRFTVEGKVLERWVWEHEFRRPAVGCEALWQKKWRAVELIGSEKALSRGVINSRIRRIVRVFRWAVTAEIVPETVYRALAAVPALQQGRTEAPESDGIKPVAVEIVEATLPRLPTPVAAMVQLQLLTGMRAGEVMIMRSIDLNTNGPTWTYTPRKHKNSYRGMARPIQMGPKAQEIVKPFLSIPGNRHPYRQRNRLP